MEKKKEVKLLVFMLLALLFDIWYNQSPYNFCKFKQNDNEVSFVDRFLLENFCKPKFTPKDENKLQYWKAKFSDDFKRKLKSCLEGAEIINIDNEKLEVSILGMKDGKCHLVYKPFDIFVSLERLQNIISFDDLEQMTMDSSISSLQVKYLSEGVIFGLNDCWEHKSSRGNCSTDLYNVNGSVIHRSISAQRNENNCIITAINEITKGSAIKYVNECILSENEAEAILSPYLNLIKSAGISQEENNETKVASDEIMHKLENGGFCTEKILLGVK